MIGYGKAVNRNTDYQIFYIAGDHSWSFSKNPKKRDFLGWYVEPQVNPARSSKGFEIELGVNLGLRNYIRLHDGFFLYQMLGSGPHYISAEVGRQAGGFIFSDNFAIGSFSRLKGNMFLNIQLRWRHVSNAGLKAPNGGIDSWNVLLGLSSLRTGIAK